MFVTQNICARYDILMRYNVLGRIPISQLDYNFSSQHFKVVLIGLVVLEFDRICARRLHCQNDVLSKNRSYEIYYRATI